MWVLNEQFDLIYEFQNIGSQYFPLAAHNNILYYITWNKDEIGLHYASLASCEEQQDNRNYSVGFKTKLSSQDSLKLQLKSLIDETLSNSKTPDQVLPHLQVLFSDVEDLDYLINAASTLCNHNLLYKPVVYPLQKRIYATGNQHLIYLISDTIIKTDLLEYVCFKGGNCYENINIFEQKFIELCVTFISKSDLDLATICWLKYTEIKHTLNADDVNNILNAIPYNIKMGALVIWFRNLVPPLLDQNPFYIDLFVKWTTDRVFLLEQSPYWPKIGLKFIAAIIEVLEISIKTICVRPISIDDLDVIKDHITYIMELKEKYKINMLLSEFSSQSPSEIALIMLRRCYTEDLEVFLQESLPSYTSRHLLEIDDTLRSFVESEAASSGGCIDGNRLKMLLNSFHSPTNRLDCLLNVLKVLDVPWDKNVLTTAAKAAALAFKDFTLTDADRMLAQEIYKELNYSKIKVILKKYNFHLTCTDYILIIHKLINAPTVDLDDLKIITNILTTYANYANTLYIDRCLRDCDTKLALQYFTNLSTRTQRVLIKTILNKYEQIITSTTTNPLLERNYTDFLKGSLLLDNIEISSIENLYYLKNSYNVLLNLSSINSSKCRESALSNLKQSEEVISSSGRGRCILQLISGEQSKLMSLLRRTSSGHNVRVLVESLILTNKNDLAVLLRYKDGQNSALLLESYEILSEVLSNCEEEHLHALLNYLSILNALIHAGIILKNLSIAWKFQYIFLPMSSLNTLNDLINYYSSFTENNFVQSELTGLLGKSDFIPFRIFANILKHSIKKGTTLVDDFFTIRDQVTKKLLSKVVALQDLDQVLVTSLLLTLKSGELMDDKIWILELLRGQSESLSPGAMHYLSTPLIRRTFNLENIFPGSTFSYPPQYILKSKFNINLSEIAFPENTEETWDVKVLLFYILRNDPHTTFERLNGLCQTLNISQNDGFSLLLVSMLSNWNLKYKIVENELGFCELSIQNDFAHLMPKCMIIWQNIEDKDFLKDILNDFWKNGELIIHGCLVSINPYYYEVYLCIYEMVFSSSNESKHLKQYYLLNFLKGYQRKSSPKQYEFELFSVKGMFPEIGHYRLPFHLFMRDDMWSNLKSEITLETYERWLPVVALLSLDGELQTANDMICSNAVKQTMTNRKRFESNDTESKDNEPWRLISLEEPLLRTAHRCVRHIANMEWAGACLFYVLQGCARGADQVAAAQLCYQFSQRWATVQPGNRAVRQMERLHSTLSTRHALHKIEWACEELIRLTTEPAQLIHALYLHPNFVDKFSRHDINRAANEIADKNGINISSIRIQILENILEKTYKDNKSLHGLEIKDLITAKYILKATCPKMGAIYLSRIAFDEESDHNKCKKLRALQCLISVIDSDTALKVTNRQRDVLWLSLLELLYVVKLEKIDVPWVVATFMQNKTVALSQLLQVAGNNIESLKIAAELAHKFGNAHLMREIIPMLLRTSLYEEIIPLILKVQNPPDNIIYSAWKAIILSPFQRADYPITDRQKSKCLNALNLLPVCPVIKDDDLIEIWKNCVRCKCLGLGCLILPYMSPETRQNLSELRKVDRRNLIISLKNLHTESYLVSGAMYVIENLTPKLYR
ncbi:jg19271 [Pararge aegeria aegeria]|uniref:Jg19271 protein n=2 Tax=Pararge aegeria TaxID=116150 RepID=A0A8S4RRW5_9NEOP|nr:jg19271 [Pararge aegeria aegeria]